MFPSITNDSLAYNNASGIGLGYKNSLAIVAQGNDTTTAAGAARAYSGGSQSDWYLPSTAELNLLLSVGKKCSSKRYNTVHGRSSQYWCGRRWWFFDRLLEFF